MSNIQQNLGFVSPMPIDTVRAMDINERVLRAIELLREHEPDDGYYVAFSGGKDSCAIKKLVQMAKVKHECWYSQTTIDPPELVRFIKEYHSDVKWNLPKHGNMMHRVATRKGTPPTRSVRWCCEEYKENCGGDSVRVFGVRSAESKAREDRWRELSEYNGKPVVCPIVYWTDDQLWEFIRLYEVPYCSLYDEGWDRLGCVGCPLINKTKQDKEFARWPAFERNWKKAVIANWERYKDLPRERDGKPRYQAKFNTGEEFWQWWRNEKTPDLMREDCQLGLLWTNQEQNEE
jgi:phosphoadenosine phosphosulfate reductase